MISSRKIVPVWAASKRPVRRLASRPGVRLFADPDDLRSIEEMCDLVDRLPLGIELAAAAAADSGVEVALSELRSHHGLLDAPGLFVRGSNDYYAPVVKNPARYLLPDDGRRSVNFSQDSTLIEQMQTREYVGRTVQLEGGRFQ